MFMLHHADLAELSIQPQTGSGNGYSPGDLSSHGSIYTSMTARRSQMLGVAECWHVLRDRLCLGSCHEIRAYRLQLLCNSLVPKF